MVASLPAVVLEQPTVEKAVLVYLLPSEATKPAAAVATAAAAAAAARVEARATPTKRYRRDRRPAPAGRVAPRQGAAAAVAAARVMVPRTMGLSTLTIARPWSLGGNIPGQRESRLAAL